MVPAVDRDSLHKTREYYGVKKEKPPMHEFFGEESIFNKKYDSALLNTIGHELNHLITAYKLGVPLEATTLTAVPKGDILGQVTLPDYIDYGTLQVIAMAGSVPTHDGNARGFGSDVYKAKLIEIFGKGKSIHDARREAESLISFYNSDVRLLCAKIIAFLQTEKGMGHIQGEMFRDIEQRARYELESKHIKPKTPQLFEDVTPEEKANKKKIEATAGRPPDKRTIIEYLPDNKCLIRRVTDGFEEETVAACSYCLSPAPHHTEFCEVVKIDKSHIEPKSYPTGRSVQVYPPDSKIPKDAAIRLKTSRFSNPHVVIQ